MPVIIGNQLKVKQALALMALSAGAISGETSFGKCMGSHALTGTDNTSANVFSSQPLWWHRLMMCQADVAHENGKLGRGQIH